MADVGPPRPPMTDERYKELTEILEGRRKEIEAELVSYRGEKGLDPVIIRARTLMLKRINHALMQHEHHDYGYCRRCGGEIAVKDLRALPLAVRCKICRAADQNAELKHNEKNVLEEMFAPIKNR